MGFNRCGYFAKNGKQEKDSTETEEGDRVPKPKKKRSKNPRQTPKKGAMIGMLPTPRVEWWEMLNWEKMKKTWKLLPPELKEKIREKGLAPKE